MPRESKIIRQINPLHLWAKTRTVKSLSPPPLRRTPGRNNPVHSENLPSQGEHATKHPKKYRGARHLDRSSCKNQNAVQHIEIMQICVQAVKVASRKKSLYVNTSQGKTLVTIFPLSTKFDVETGVVSTSGYTKAT